MSPDAHAADQTGGVFSGAHTGTAGADQAGGVSPIVHVADAD